MRTFLFTLLLAATFALPAPACRADSRLELVRAVLVSRHGVRAPGTGPAALARLSPRPWPIWTVAPGALSAHGARNMRLLGAFLGTTYATEGLLPSAGCTAARQVMVWADNSTQRTRDSGQALLDGLLPGCQAHVQFSQPIDRPEPMFHPVQSGICSLDEHAAMQSVHEQTGDLAQQLAGQRPALLLLGQLLHPDMDATALHRWADGPLSLSTGSTGHDLKLGAPWGTAAAVSEIFSLEYAEGLPADQVAWGAGATTPHLAQFMPLHNLKLEWIEQAPYIAARNGSMLAQRVLDELERGSGRPASADDTPLLVALIGHDTNIANLSGMLRLHWHDTRQPDDVAPGTTLAFELLRDTHSGEYFVRTRLFMQTADQLRSAVPLDAEHSPIVQVLAIPGCLGARDGLCPLAAFSALLRSRIDPQCVTDSAEHTRTGPH